MKFLLSLSIVVFATQVFAQMAPLLNTRWTIDDQKPAALFDIVPILSAQLHIPLEVSSFQLKEQRSLQGLNFKNYVQTIAGVPVRGAGIRIWTDAVNNQLVQMIARVQDPSSSFLKFRLKAFSALSAKKQLERLDFSSIRKLAGSQLKEIRNFKVEQVIYQQTPAIWLEVFGKDRMMTFAIRNSDGKVIFQKLRYYPRGDVSTGTGEYSMIGKAYTINEENDIPWGCSFSGAEPQQVEIRYLKTKSRKSPINWKQFLAKSEFPGSMMDEEKAATPSGAALGYWSRATVQEMIRQATQQIVEVDNVASLKTPASFDGRYVTVLLDGNASQIAPLNFNVEYSPFASQSWTPTNNDWILSIMPASFGKAFTSSADLLARPAVRQIVHDNAANMQSGFDEMQVYWTVTKWFEVMQAAGFNDIELSTRPIQAYLFDPDIEMQDNAYYNDDTINFTTYSERNGNEARNLYTVWHELGHGLMDRLQGDSGFSNGGLSEGIADFAAEMVLRGLYLNNLHPAYDRRRIVNKIGFGLTNEGHDDGEAYGGSLRDILEQAITRDGYIGYLKVCDLILTAMRLTRSSTDLNLDEWFDAIVLADRLGAKGLRAEREFEKEIVATFYARNFIKDHAGSRVSVVYSSNEVSEDSEGSRHRPVVLNLNETEVKDLQIDISVPDLIGNYKFPIVAEVHFEKTNALQGAVRFKDEATQTFVFNSPQEIYSAKILPTGKCDYVNNAEGFCKDFANIQFFEKGQSEPFAKKRFYVEIKGRNP